IPFVIGAHRGGVLVNFGAFLRLALAGFGYIRSVLARLITIPATAAAAAAAAATSIAFAIAMLRRTGFDFRRVLDLVLFFSDVVDNSTVDADMSRGALVGIGGYTRLTLFDGELVPGHLAISRDGDRQAIAHLKLRKSFALIVEDVECHFH